MKSFKWKFGLVCAICVGSLILGSGGSFAMESEESNKIVGLVNKKIDSVVEGGGLFTKMEGLKLDESAEEKKKSGYLIRDNFENPVEYGKNRIIKDLTVKGYLKLKDLESKGYAKLGEKEKKEGYDWFDRNFRSIFDIKVKDSGYFTLNFKNNVKDFDFVKYGNGHYDYVEFCGLLNILNENFERIFNEIIEKGMANCENRQISSEGHFEQVPILKCSYVENGERIIYINLFIPREESGLSAKKEDDCKTLKFGDLEKIYYSVSVYKDHSDFNSNKEFSDLAKGEAAVESVDNFEFLGDGFKKILFNLLKKCKLNDSQIYIAYHEPLIYSFLYNNFMILLKKKFSKLIRIVGKFREPDAGNVKKFVLKMDAKLPNELNRLNDLNIGYFGKILI